MEVPIQFFQSIIAIELAVAGALLFQIRFFVPRGEAEREGEHQVDPRLRLLMAVIIGVTVFGSLESMLHEGKKPAAVVLIIGLAASLLPILLRALPRLTKPPDSEERDREVVVTIIGLIVYFVVTAVAVVLVVV